MAAALLALVGALIYANSLAAPFTFDDEAAIVGNASIRSLGGALTPPDRGEPVAGRPIVNLSFALNYAASGLDPRSYRAVNIALHVACAWLLFALVRRTLAGGPEGPPLRPSHFRLKPEATPKKQSETTQKKPDPDFRLKPEATQKKPEGPPLRTSPFRLTPEATAPIAFVAALIWLVHPLNSETVNYVSQRTESLMALFYLLTLYATARGWPAVAVAACAAGMACKETMATAPIVVLLYDRAFLAGSFAAAWRARRTFYLALAATWVLLDALIWSGPRWESAGFYTGITPWTYLLNQAVIVVEYLRRAVWPQALVFDYGEPVEYMLGDVLPQALFVVLLLAATVWALVRRPAIGFLAACFFIILAPTSSIIPIATEVGAERRLYLPLAALVVLAAAGAQAIGVKAAGARRGALSPTAVLAGGVALAVPLAAATVDRNRAYLNGVVLWEATLDRWPSARAHRNLATELKRAGRREEAIAHLREAVKGHPEGRYALGFELYEQRRHAEAAQELRQFIRDYPADANIVTAHRLIADSLREQEDYAGAVEHYEAVVKARPSDVAMLVGLGFSLASSGRLPQAEAALRRAIELDARNGVAEMTLGLVIAAQPGRLEVAARHLRAAVQLDPGNVDAREHLANVEKLLR